MTCQRALCANSDEKDDIEKDFGEKVALSQESGSLDGKHDKNAKIKTNANQVRFPCSKNVFFLCFA